MAITKTLSFYGLADVRFVPIADISEQFKNLARAGEVRQPLYVSFVTVGRELISSSR